MSQSLVKILAHIVFSTKDRVNLITPEIELKLFAYMSGIFKNNGARLIIGGAAWDHVHLLVSMGRIDISKLIGAVKRDSSVWIKEQDKQFAKFYWQRGYGLFSIGQSQVPAVSRYIQNQREHHKQQPFQDEFRALCGKYDVEFDERYCWD